jgi:glycosyltransferase involved in cell wall biosynthesis
MLPIISIIVPTYNQEKYISRCIRSLLSQSLKKELFEIIVVNDGSKDKTEEVLKNFKKDIIIVKNKKNLGLPKSLNLAIKKAKSNYIIRVDSDDYVNEEFLSIIIKFVQLNPEIDAFACDYYMVDDNEKIIKRVNCQKKPIACGIIFKIHHLIDIGLYDEKFLINEEKDLRIRFKKKYSIDRIALPLYRYRQHKKSLTRNKLRKKNYDLRLIQKHEKK